MDDDQASSAVALPAWGPPSAAAAVCLKLRSKQSCMTDSSMAQSLAPTWVSSDAILVKMLPRGIDFAGIVWDDYTTTTEVGSVVLLSLAPVDELPAADVALAMTPTASEHPIMFPS